MKHLYKPLMALALLFSFAEAKEFVIDNTHSNIGFSVKHMMISNVKGNFNTYTADIDFDTDKKVFNKLSAKIEASSIDTGITKRDDHLRSSDFFDADKFKTVDFVMTSMKDGKVYGKLTIHGVTKDIVLESKVHGVIKDFQGHQRVGFTLEGKLNRKDFGLTWNKILEGGGMTVDENVNLSIDVEAIEL
ncbi:YceI family protein [Sulfurospirillum oryzae]|uniref:YceI family protein n=1 Tax=Sulfurospirillum oryzae TaxID=2976535 RepID=UPI0021E95D40|nr:YceI family protein [Sulfurospirillum oryzae]